ncbi:hypothetical protein Misp01_22610 [Microtetraspora sp. NBRC 13810]|uniref:ATP-binding protein n=1 Tax=Microtetraspora sp. NBRC 13810 TaxID=3030990 RepID=UPI0024A13822|nr:ATP-binding protein [Microtetraspora sp. NBRC 13810]GLW07131.1 hypothetical protein Misp01_22610 [Microtetraspora sp. NBRC 13810]
MSAGDVSRPITDDLSGLRAQVHDYGAKAGLSGQRLGDLVIAVNEAAINVLEHGGGRGTLTITSDRAEVTAEITDTAGGLTARHLRQPKPDHAALRGHGLWLIRQLCDRIVLDHPGGVSRLRLYMRLDLQV